MFYSTFIISTVLTLIFYAPTLRLMTGANCTKPNWRKHYVVSSFGIFLPLIMVCSTAVFSFQFFARTGRGTDSQGLLALLSLVLATGFVGFIDDLLGNRVIGGLRGHFSQLRFGIMTTGTLKAVIGFAVSVTTAAFFSANILEFLTNLSVLTLAINAANLFDLRPGRAIKVFTLGALATFIASWNSAFWGFWGLIIPPVGGLLWGDLKEHSMMGDSGSNALGAILGLSFVINLPWVANLVILGFLVALHLFAEQYSISSFIERAPILKQLDELGQKR